MKISEAYQKYGFTPTEWAWVLYMERLRGLTKKQITETIGCDRNDLEKHWGITLPYARVFAYSRASLDRKVTYYLDVTCRTGEPALTTAELASLMGATEEEVQGITDVWNEEVSSGKRWPIPCARCRIVGTWHNPIMENNHCLQCNGQDRGWPLEEWRENGQMVALLHSWGLVPDSQVAERYLEGEDNDI